MNTLGRSRSESVNMTGIYSFGGNEKRMKILINKYTAPIMIADDSLRRSAERKVNDTTHTPYTFADLTGTVGDRNYAGYIYYSRDYTEIDVSLEVSE